MLRKNYSERLRSRDNVWYGGHKVEALEQHPAFVGAIEQVQAYHKLIEKSPDKFGFQDLGQLSAISLMIPRAREDLARKRHAYKSVADMSHGLLGRTPDFMNAALCAIASNSDKLGNQGKVNFSENAWEIYLACARENSFVSHAAINPQVDRSKSLGELNNTFAGVRVVDKRADGIIVSGAKMIVTMGPLCDEIAVFNMPGLRQGDDDFAVAFVIPANAEGLRFLCRNSTVRPEQTAFDRPLSNKFDEMDALLILEDVFVPWERVLVYRDVEKSNQFFDSLRIRHHTGHQGIIRGLAKIEFVGGVAIKVAHALGLYGFLPVQQKLGEITSFVELTRAVIHNVEQTAQLENNSVVVPNSSSIQALRLQFPKWYRAAVETIQSLCAGSMTAVPSENDFFNDNKRLLNQIFDSASVTPLERHALLNLAWDITGTEFGQRQLVYENFHSGDPMRIAAGHLASFDTSDMMSSVSRALEVEYAR